MMINNVRVSVMNSCPDATGIVLEIIKNNALHNKAIICEYHPGWTPWFRFEWKCLFYYFVRKGAGSVLL